MFKIINQDLAGNEIELMRTIFRFAGNEGSRYETIEQAEAALAKAKQFHKARFFKASRIVEA